MTSKEMLFVILMAFIVPSSGVQDTVIQVSTIKWSQVVSERFLSLSIDPLAIILAGKLGPAAINMAKGLSPLFVRIGGPNTEKVRFGTNPSSRNNISVTEEEWVAVNRFAQEARMDLVLCLRAMRRTQTVWDSANALEIISASHKHGFTDIWQMGWDMSEMTGIGGSELGRDIVRLKKILDAFPGYENAPILAPGLSCCLNHFQTRFIKDLLLESSTAVSALPVHLNFSNISLEKVPEIIGSTLVQMEEQIWNKDLLLRSALPRKPIWMSELEPNAGEFQDAMKWIIKLGAAARFGVQVMMRQPHLWSFHSPTHDYWASLLHKNLVGRFVFDTRVISGNKSSTFIYSHCTHPTNDETTILSSKWNYDKGAMTLFGVNPSSESIKVMARGISVKDEMLHLYILTEDSNDASKDNRLHPSHTLFNGQKLILSPKGELPLLSPKERRVSRNQAISVPPQSIFFMVFPDVKLRMCMSNPFGTDEFQDLTKRLSVAHSNAEDAIDSWEDNNAERVYVSFSKRIPIPHKPHSPQEELKSKLLKDWHKVAGKLGIEKGHGDDMENVKYNFYNDQSWLSRLADGLEKDSSENVEAISGDKKKSESDSEQARLEKYALLTSAIYGKDNNGTNLYKVTSNLNEGADPYSRHYRSIRSVNSDQSQAEKVDKENQNKAIDHIPATDDSNKKSDTNSVESVSSDRKTLKKGLATENYKNIHEYVLDYMDKSGKSTENAQVNLPLHTFIKDLENVDVSVGQSVQSELEKSLKNEPSPVIPEELLTESPDMTDETASHQIVKRSPTIHKVRNQPKSSTDEDASSIKHQNQKKDEIIETDFEDVSTYLKNKDNLPNLVGVKENDLRQIIDENVENGAAFEVAPEPEDEELPEENTAASEIDSTTDKALSDEDSKEEKDENTSSSDDQTTSEKLNNENPVEVSTDSNDGENVEQSTHVEEEIAQKSSDVEDSKRLDLLNLDQGTQESEALSKRDDNTIYPQYSLDGIKPLPKLGRISEILEQLKAKGVSAPGAYRSAKLEERIQKLEGIKSRVSEIREKIKSELNKAREKLAHNLDTIKDPSDPISKKNIYDVPDKLAAILEKINFNYMNKIPSKVRFRRSPVLTDDEIDEILERELSETADEFYKEQMMNLEDEDYSDQSDSSNFHYLVPAMPGTHNVLMDREVFPAKIYNMVKGDKLHNAANIENENFNSRLDLRDVLEKIQNRNKINLHMLNEQQNNYNKMMEFNDRYDNFQYPKNLGFYDRANRNTYGVNNLRPYMPENGYEPTSYYDPQENLSYRRNVLRSKRKYSPGIKKRPFYYYDDNEEDDVDVPLIVYPRNAFGFERFKRSTDLKETENHPPEQVRQKRSINDEDIRINAILKDSPSKDYKEDPVKIKVDQMFKNGKVSLHHLAKEYTKLAEDKDNNDLLVLEQIKDTVLPNLDIKEVLNSSDPNKTVFEGVYKMISNGENYLSKGMNFINDIKVNELLESSKDSIDKVLSNEPLSGANEEEYTEDEYSEDWVNNAERVSSPLPETKVTKPPKKSNDGHVSSTLGRLMKKIKHIIKLISGFKISDYIKGKKNPSPDTNH